MGCAYIYECPECSQSTMTPLEEVYIIREKKSHLLGNHSISFINNSGVIIFFQIISSEDNERIRLQIGNDVHRWKKLESWHSLKGYFIESMKSTTSFNKEDIKLLAEFHESIKIKVVSWALTNHRFIIHTTRSRDQSYRHTQ